MMIIKIAISVIDAILAILLLFFASTDKNNNPKNFFAFLMFLFCANAILIWN